MYFFAPGHSIRIRSRFCKAGGWLTLVEPINMNRGSTRQSVLCAVSASPECLMNRGELHLLRKGSPAHHARPRGSASNLSTHSFCGRLRPKCKCRILKLVHPVSSLPPCLPHPRLWCGVGSGCAAGAADWLNCARIPTSSRKTWTWQSEESGMKDEANNG